MDELSAFHGAPPSCSSSRRELFARADVVFTGGPSLYEAKRDAPRQRPLLSEQRRRRAFRAQARDRRPTRPIRRTSRIRASASSASSTSAWTWICSTASRPRGPSGRSCWSGRSSRSIRRTLPQRAEHPLPRAASRTRSCRRTSPAGTSRCCRSRCNESTRFISPTKTPEYLAGGPAGGVDADPRRRRAVRRRGLVRIADDARRSSSRADRAPRSRGPTHARTPMADAASTHSSRRMSWDRTQRADERAAHAPGHATTRPTSAERRAPQRRAAVRPTGARRATTRAMEAMTMFDY